MKKIVFGLTGFICSGKGVAARVIRRRLAAKKFSLGDEIRAVIKKRGKRVTRERLQETSLAFRKRFGQGVWAKRVTKKIKAFRGRFFVVDDFRNLAEVREFKHAFGKNFVLIAVSAPLRVRFKRAVARARESEKKTFEEFKAIDARERSGGGYGFEIDSCIKRADYGISNNSSRSAFEEKMAALIKKIK